ncbi:MAG: 50S ribosomal protein L15 [bacterium]
MITLHTLPKPKGSTKPKRRIGRGYGSGRAKTSGRGSKGQGARSNRGSRPGFEGGQVRLVMRLPKKRGFSALNKKEYQVVNASQLNRLPANTEVTPTLLAKKGYIPSAAKPTKVLATGELTVALKFSKQHFAFSEAAVEKITKAGGSVSE